MTEPAHVSRYQHLIDACTTPQQCIELGKLLKLAARNAPADLVPDLCRAAYALGRRHGQLDPLAFLNGGA
jgi:hypothetical protein